MQSDSNPESDGPKNPSDRNFVIQLPSGEELDNVFTGQSPSLAARKAARSQIDPEGYTSSEEAEENNAEELRIRERGTDTLHVYKAWTWKRPREDDEPEWLNDMVTEAGVDRRGTLPSKK